MTDFEVRHEIFGGARARVEADGRITVTICGYSHGSYESWADALRTGWHADIHVGDLVEVNDTNIHGDPNPDGYQGVIAKVVGEINGAYGVRALYDPRGRTLNRQAPDLRKLTPDECAEAERTRAKVAHHRRPAVSVPADDEPLLVEQVGEALGTLVEVCDLSLRGPDHVLVEMSPPVPYATAARLLTKAGFLLNQTRPGQAFGGAVLVMRPTAPARAVEYVVASRLTPGSVTIIVTHPDSIGDRGEDFVRWSQDKIIPPSVPDAIGKAMVGWCGGDLCVLVLPAQCAPAPGDKWLPIATIAPRRMGQAPARPQRRATIEESGDGRYACSIKQFDPEAFGDSWVGVDSETFDSLDAATDWVRSGLRR